MAYNNTYAVVVKQSFANQYHLKNISDLLKIENKLHGGSIWNSLIVMMAIKA